MTKIADTALNAGEGPEPSPLAELKRGQIVLPEGLHLLTASLVCRFAVALAEKLRKAEMKYDYRGGWALDDWQDECREHLLDHVAKGDPLDVAAYCAFMWHHGWSTAASALPAPESGADEVVAKVER